MKKQIVGKYKKYNGSAIVSFLDLLGFSKFILNNWNSTNNPLDKILLLKDVINNKNNSLGLKLRMNNPDDKKEISYYCNTRTISDSIIIMVPIDNTVVIADVFFLILSIINNIGRLWGSCLDSGFTIRGGIDYGDIYWDTNEIIGPALINAYTLEVNTAKTSRIVCGEGFTKIVLDVSEKVQAMNIMMLKNFMFDVDGLLCINPHVMYDVPEHKVELIANIRELMRGQPSYIQQKYVPLEKSLYNEERLHIPTLENLREYMGAL